MIAPFLLLLIWFLGLALCLSAADPYSPKIQPASNEAEQTQKRIRVPQGMRDLIEFLASLKEGGKK